MLALGACLLLSACADIAIIETTPLPSSNTQALPPIGFNHRYGNNPITAKDGLALERSLFGSGVFWEVAIREDPELAGYVDLAKPAEVKAARHAAKEMTLVIATEDGKTITGMLAFPTNAGQQKYCQRLIDRLRSLGYDAFTRITVLVYFTESDRHATLTWKQGSAPVFQVLDNNLLGSYIRPHPGQTPLPLPPAH